VRERWREGAVHEPAVVVVVVVVVAAFDCLREMGCSGRRMVDEAGLEPPTTLDETELLRGLSQGMVLWRLREAGLIWVESRIDDQCIDLIVNDMDTYVGDYGDCTRGRRRSHRQSHSRQ